MNEDSTQTQTRFGVRERSIPSLEPLAVLYRQTEYSTARLIRLRERASEELLEDTVVLEAFQELDSAHEELRVAEEHLQIQADAIVHAYDALDVERRRHVELFDGAPEAYFVTDFHGNVRQANRCASELLNIDGTFLVGKPLLSFVDSKDRQRFTELVSRAARQDRVLRCEIRMQPRHCARPLWVALSIAANVASDAQNSGLRWLVRPRLAERGVADSDHETSLEVQLRKRTQELADTKYLLDRCLLREQETRQSAQGEARSKNALLAKVAHELRDPLISISGWLDMINSDRASASIKARALASMEQSLRTLGRIVDELVENARLDERNARLEFRAVELPAVLQQALDACRPAALQKNVRLIAELAPDIPQLRADPERLQQIFLNLLSNALKFTPALGEISVSLRCCGEQAEVAIRDTGSGIEPELLAVLFEPFSGLLKKSAISQGGLGLGLHIAQRLVELHGGTIAAESDGPGRGATFRVRFALDAGPPATEA